MAEEIGGNDNDTDQAENLVFAMVEKESDCDSDEDDEGFDDIYDSDEFDDDMAEEEVVKRLDQFQNDYD